MARVNIKEILACPRLRELLLVRAGVALQRREGIKTTVAQMRRAYRKVRGQRSGH